MAEKEYIEGEEKEKSDYIDRAHYCKRICKCNRESCDRAACPIWNAPAADVVPVVRCKDCKWFRSVRCAIDEQLETTKENDYCSFGERKDGEIK